MRYARTQGIPTSSSGHEGVGYTCRICFCQYNLCRVVGKDAFERLEADEVKVEVESAVIEQDEVTRRVNALDRVHVRAEGGQEPGVARCDERVELSIGPEAVGHVWVHGLARGHRLTPLFGNDVCLPRAMQNLWDGVTFGLVPAHQKLLQTDALTTQNAFFLKRVARPPPLIILYRIVGA